MRGTRLMAVITALVCAGCAVCTGCQGADFRVHVLWPNGVAQRDAIVRLAPEHNKGCEPAELSQKNTRPDGTVHIQTPWCGPARLIVNSLGMLPSTRLIDTCNAGSTTFSLTPLPVARESSAPAVHTILAFLKALAHDDAAGVERHLAQPENSDIYRYGGPGIHRISATSRQPVMPVRAESLRMSHDGDRQTVDMLLGYEDGCEATWRFEVNNAGGTPRIAAITPLTQPALIRPRALPPDARPVRRHGHGRGDRARH